jgi:hypothetical protein
MAAMTDSGTPSAAAQRSDASSSVIPKGLPMAATYPGSGLRTSSGARGRRAVLHPRDMELAMGKVDTVPAQRRPAPHAHANVLRNQGGYGPRGTPRLWQGGSETPDPNCRRQASNVASRGRRLCIGEAPPT